MTGWACDQASLRGCVLAGYELVDSCSSPGVGEAGGEVSVALPLRIVSRAITAKLFAGVLQLSVPIYTEAPPCQVRISVISTS